jgi:hypothetical protein
MRIRVAFVRTNVSEERITSIIRVKIISVLQLLVTANVSSSLILSIWWWRRYILPKHQLLQEPHSVTSQKTIFFTSTCLGDPRDKDGQRAGRQGFDSGQAQDLSLVLTHPGRGGEASHSSHIWCQCSEWWSYTSTPRSAFLFAVDGRRLINMQVVHGMCLKRLFTGCSQWCKGAHN